MERLKKSVQFYKGRRRLSFRVNNKQDAEKALLRFKVPAGWYVEKDRVTLEVVTNEKIYSVSGKLFM